MSLMQFKNLVFEGGGVKGIAYAGALEVLERNAVMDGIERVAGTSAGAITAALVAMGCKSKDVKEILGATNFGSFADDSFGVIRDMYRLCRRYGWHDGDAFLHWFEGVVEQYAEKDCTFAHVRGKQLSVVGTDLSTQSTFVMNGVNTPNMRIADAVRVSMSIPLYFAAIKRLEGVSCESKRLFSALRKEGVFVDGGVTWNYPIDLFDDKASCAASSHVGNEYVAGKWYNMETLGLKLGACGGPVRCDIWNVKDYVKVLLNYMLESANNVHLHKNDWHRTVFIDSCGVAATDFDLPNEKIEQLVESGRQGTSKYLGWFENSGEAMNNAGGSIEDDDE